MPPPKNMVIRSRTLMTFFPLNSLTVSGYAISDVSSSDVIVPVPA